MRSIKPSAANTRPILRTAANAGNVLLVMIVVIVFLVVLRADDPVQSTPHRHSLVVRRRIALGAAFPAGGGFSGGGGGYSGGGGDFGGGGASGGW